MYRNFSILCSEDCYVMAEAGTNYLRAESLESPATEGPRAAKLTNAVGGECDDVVNTSFGASLFNASSMKPFFGHQTRSVIVHGGSRFHPQHSDM